MKYELSSRTVFCFMSDLPWSMVKKHFELSVSFLSFLGTFLDRRFRAWSRPCPDTFLLAIISNKASRMSFRSLLESDKYKKIRNQFTVFNKPSIYSKAVLRCLLIEGFRFIHLQVDLFSFFQLSFTFHCLSLVSVLFVSLELSNIMLN